MIDTTELSDVQIPGVQEVYQDYGTVLRAGVYQVTLSDTTHVKLVPGVNKKGKPFTKLSGLTYRVVADGDGNEDSVSVGRVLPYQQSWIETLVNGVLNKTQIADGQGPQTEKAQAGFLDTIAADGLRFKVKVDWKAFDTEVYNALLVELTDSEDREDPIEAAKGSATKAMKAEAAKAATLAETYSDFPLNEKTGERIGVIKTATGEVRAKAEVVRYFLAPEAVETTEDADLQD